MARAKIRNADETNSFLSEFVSQTDRGLAIIAAAVIDDSLAYLIEQRLIPLSERKLNELFGRLGPFNSLSSKIEMGVALGVYDEQIQKTLDMIREVRNKFAHQLGSTTFDDPEIAKMVATGVPPAMSMASAKTTREIFQLCFAVVFILLRALNFANVDIRIKPLSETHPKIFEPTLTSILGLIERLKKPQSPD